MLKFKGDREPEIDHIVKKEDLENKKLTGLTQIIRENKFLNDYSINSQMKPEKYLRLFERWKISRVY